MTEIGKVPGDPPRPRSGKAVNTSLAGEAARAPRLPAAGSVPTVTLPKAYTGDGAIDLLLASSPFLCSRRAHIYELRHTTELKMSLIKAADVPKHMADRLRSRRIAARLSGGAAEANPPCQEASGVAPRRAHPGNASGARYPLKSRPIPPARTYQPLGEAVLGVSIQSSRLNPYPGSKTLRWRPAMVDVYAFTDSFSKRPDSGRFFCPARADRDDGKSCAPPAIAISQWV